MSRHQCKQCILSLCLLSISRYHKGSRLDNLFKQLQKTNVRYIYFWLGFHLPKLLFMLSVFITFHPLIQKESKLCIGFHHRDKDVNMCAIQCKYPGQSRIFSQTLWRKNRYAIQCRLSMLRKKYTHSSANSFPLSPSTGCAANPITLWQA